MASGGRSGSGNDVMPVNLGAEIHPKGLFEAISFIEQNFANELGGAVIRQDFLTTKQRLEFFEVGFRSAFLSGLVTALLAPLAIGVIERHIPVFGSSAPNLFDTLFALLLAVGFSLGYALFLAISCTKFIGHFTRAMVLNLLGGVVSGALLKALVAVIFFHFLYLFVLSDAHLTWAALKLYDTALAPQAVQRIFAWVAEVRATFLTAAWFVVVTTLLFLAIPFAALAFALRRNRRLIEAGLVKLPDRRRG
ncbi:hypothetical protein [Geoalkalibacter sp.]|uniref:hypothetical protein n=1 Tax=Geoalkalibacter sp. TaxID=3041440 RepID=UPI00272DF3DF|nr:hypothetical protein [Geoalkalibacter sp.]